MAEQHKAVVSALRTVLAEAERPYSAIYFALGERMGLRTASGPSTSVTINAPKAPGNTK